MKGIAPLLNTAALAFCLLGAGGASANSHLWRISELFSNADGSVQFIEMQEIAGADGEVELGGKSFLSNTKQYVFPNDLPGGTAFKTLLMATQGFADLDGAPTPDYVIPDAFFDPKGDKLVYFVYDAFQFDSAQLPSDGVQSLNRFNLAQQPNSPKNFADESGSVQAPPFDACLLDVGLAHDGAGLSMDLDVGLAGAGTWNAWISANNSLLPLWSIPLPNGLPALQIPFSVPISDLGTVMVITTLTTSAQGIVCQAVDSVHTGP